MEFTRELAEAIVERRGELTLSSVPLLCQLEKTGVGTLAGQERASVKEQMQSGPRC